MRDRSPIPIQGFLDFWSSGLLPRLQESSNPEVQPSTSSFLDSCPDESRNWGSGSSAEAETQDERTRI